MFMKVYLAAGAIMEARILANYIKDKVPYSAEEIIVGGIIDILAWPIVLLWNK